MNPSSITYDKTSGDFIWSSQDSKSATINLWKNTFPTVDVESEMQKMRVWLMANPRKAAKKNWMRFVAGWLMRQNDKNLRERNVADAKRQHLNTPRENLEFSARW